MRVLIACEFSGIVRDAFAALGHEAWSCDLLTNETKGNHIQGDALEHLIIPSAPWDLLIAHPPCTYLCNSGVRWLAGNSNRHKLMQDACDFFANLFASNIPRICIENPVMHKYARNYLEETWRITRHDARPSQSIQPWQFGHGETKRTCLWLRNLPPLQATHRKDDLFSIAEPTERLARVHRASPGPNRWKERSRTYHGIAKAMAEQWGIF